MKKLVFKIATGIVLLSTALLLGTTGAKAAPPLPVEQLTGGHSVKVAPDQRIYVMDSVFLHLIDSRLNIYDRNTGKFLGMIPTAFNGQALLSKDGKQIYVATTYFERITRGKRSDVIEVWDNEKLSFVREIKIPAKRAGALNYDGIFRQTENGHFILVQNATPATSVSVVDMRKNVFISEITATAGCWSIIPVPGKPQSFTTICGDGTLLTITLGDDGKVASQSRSKPMFSVNDDPIFITPGRLRDALVFVSFHGNVYTARSQNNDSMKFEPVWSLLDDADRAQRWLPGGYNLLAVEPKSERLYILMHRNGTEGSHKNPADEIWVYDLKTRKRVARVPGKSALSMSIVQGNNPQLLTIDGTKVRVFDISEPEPREILTIPEAAEASLQVMGYMGGKGGNE